MKKETYKLILNIAESSLSVITGLLLGLSGGTIVIMVAHYMATVMGEASAAISLMKLFGWGCLALVSLNILRALKKTKKFAGVF